MTSKIETFTSKVVSDNSEDAKYYITVNNQKYRLQDNKSRNPFNYNRFEPFLNKEVVIEGSQLGKTKIILVNTILVLNKKDRL